MLNSITLNAQAKNASKMPIAIVLALVLFHSSRGHICTTPPVSVATSTFCFGVGGIFVVLDTCCNLRLWYFFVIIAPFSRHTPPWIL